MTDRTSTDVPTIKKEHELGNGFPFYRISGINTVPELVNKFQFFRFLAVTEVAGKAYTTEPFGKYMHEEGIQELCAAHMHRFGFPIISVIFVMERYAGIIYGINPAVADGAAEYVAGKIGNGVAEPVKRFFDMRDPVFMVKPVNEFPPFIAVAEIQAASAKLKFFLAVVLFQSVQKLSAVKPAHGIFWEKVSFMGSFHKLAGASQPSAGKHGMDMGMEIQLLALCMQYGNNSGSCSKMLFVTA